MNDIVYSIPGQTGYLARVKKFCATNNSKSERYLRSRYSNALPATERTSTGCREAGHGLDDNAVNNSWKRAGSFFHRHNSERTCHHDGDGPFDVLPVACGAKNLNNL